MKQTGVTRSWRFATASGDNRLKETELRSSVVALVVKSKGLSSNCFKEVHPELTTQRKASRVAYRSDHRRTSRPAHSLLRC